MKTLPWTLVLTASIVTGNFSGAGADVRIGDTREAVFETLGEPTGFAETDDIEAYTFERGRVVFRGGRVTEHTIVSAEQAQRRQALAERRRENRLDEGTALRDMRLQDEEFAALPAVERLAFWDTFRQRYPDVDVGIEHAVAARQVEIEDRRELRELELRLLEAERMAQLAREYPPPAYVSFGHSGLPFAFGDPFITADPFFTGDPFLARKDRFVTDPRRDFTFPVRQPPPLPPTGRERFMPLQQMGTPPPAQQVVVPKVKQAPRRDRRHSK